MRRLLLTVIVVAIIAFYSGVAGAASSPYLGAIQEFVQGATSGTMGGTLERTPTPSPFATPPSITTGAHISPTLRARLKAAVQHLSTSGQTTSKRVNILLLGSDNDQKFASYSAPLTQVMIVLSIDPVSKTVTLLSIPRDFWVHIPGYRYNVGPDGTVGWSKIDIASEFGFDSAACTVEYNFGVPIDHWVWVGLNGFIKVINTLGGVTLDVPHPVIDDTYPDDLGSNPYAYRRIYLPPGPQHLNGGDALHFVRSRHGDVQEDFGRSSRQQILLTRLRGAILAQDPAALVALLPSLLNDFHGELRTDIPTDIPTAMSYVQLFRDASHYKMIQVVLSPPYSQPGYDALDSDPLVDQETGQYPTHENAVLPNWQMINGEIRALFGAQSSATPHCAGATTTIPPTIAPSGTSGTTP